MVQKRDSSQLLHVLCSVMFLIMFLPSRAYTQVYIDIGDAEAGPVAVNLDNSYYEVVTIDMTICDENNYLMITGCEITDRTSRFLCRYEEAYSGCSNVYLFSMDSYVAISEGTGPIFTLLYEVREEVPAAGEYVNLNLGEAPAGECVALNPEQVFVTGLFYNNLDVVASGGEFCFAGDPVSEDTDSDGIFDDEDNCPGSYVGATIVIDDCDSGVENTLFDDGCTMNDFVAGCAEEIKNHGQFVRCVTHLTNSWKWQNLISYREKGAIQRCAARSGMPSEGQ